MTIFEAVKIKKSKKFSDTDKCTWNFC